jgi:rubrerythrin
MDIFEFAVRKEKFSEDFYRDLAGRTRNKGLRTIFDMLAGEEAHHRQVIERIKAKIPAKLTETNVLSNAVDVFERMKKGIDKFAFTATDLEAYKKARDMERQSRDFYLQKADELEDNCQKGVFTKLADEEKKHLLLLENIIEFVSRPQQWLENAEFFHLDEY